jgi:hypothetical protein
VTIDVHGARGHSQHRTAMPSLPKTQYTKSGNVHIAYRVTGEYQRERPEPGSPEPSGCNAYSFPCSPFS